MDRNNKTFFPLGVNFHFYANYVNKFSFVLSTNIAAKQITYWYIVVLVTSVTKAEESLLWNILKGIITATFSKTKHPQSKNFVKSQTESEIESFHVMEITFHRGIVKPRRAIHIHPVFANYKSGRPLTGASLVATQ